MYNVKLYSNTGYCFQEGQARTEIDARMFARGNGGDYWAFIEDEISGTKLIYWATRRKLVLHKMEDVRIRNGKLEIAA